MNTLPVRIQRLTVVLLAASLSLIGPGLAGLGASVPLVVALAAAAGLLALTRAEAGGRRWPGMVPVRYLRDLWAGPLVAGVVALAMLGSSPGEVQALGGVCGLVGMLNYFLRPIYALLASLGAYLRRAAA